MDIQREAIEPGLWPIATVPPSGRNPQFNSSPADCAGAVRVLINEDTIRARERSAAGQQLSQHINDIIMGHQLVRRSPQGSSAGGKHGSSSGSTKPFVTVRSIPSASGGRLWKTSEYGATAARFEASEADFMSGPVRGWRNSTRSPTATATYGSFRQQDVFTAAEEVTAVQRSAGVGYKAVAGLHQEAGVGLGDFMKHQLQVEQQTQQQWPRDPQHSAATAAAAAPGEGTDGGAHAMDRVQQLEEGLEGGSEQAPEDSCKKMQQQLFKEAAAGGFRKLLRSMSPKHMFRPSSASAKGSAGGAGSPGANRSSGAAAGGELQWPLLVPAAGSVASSPEASSPTRSGKSFTATAAAKAAVELGAAAARRPLTPPGQFSPLKASIVAHTHSVTAKAVMAGAGGCKGALDTAWGVSAVDGTSCGSDVAYM